MPIRWVSARLQLVVLACVEHQMLCRQCHGRLWLEHYVGQGIAAHSYARTLMNPSPWCACLTLRAQVLSTTVKQAELPTGAGPASMGHSLRVGRPALAFLSHTPREDAIKAFEDVVTLIF